MRELEISLPASYAAARTRLLPNRRQATVAVSLMSFGRSVAVYKPTQAGLENGEGDIDVVRRLTGAEAHEGIRLPNPMAPVAAAQLAGITLPAADEHSLTIRKLATEQDHTLVEGAGGILVQLDQNGDTLADIAAATADADRASTTSSDTLGVLIVCRAALGTLNHTEFTVEALTHRGVPILGLVIRSWPREPTAVDLSNREYLGNHAVPPLGAVPEQDGDLQPAQFRAAARDWFRVA